jgi:D-3-phosphoglycerate dehydrogenase
MTEPIRVLFLGPTDAEAFDIASMERQSRAVRLAGGAVVRHDGQDTVALIEALRRVDAVMVQGRPFDPAAFAHMGLHGRCKGLVSFGHGFDHLDVDAATTHGVILANTASFGTEEVSNHALMLLLACARKLVLHDRLLRQGAWTRKHLAPMGHVAGQVLGLIGIGHIGRALARKARALDLRVIAYDPYVSSWDAKEYGVEMAPSVDEVCRQADYVSLHVPLGPATRHLIGRRQLELMKPTAYLINCARGGVVDEAALVEVLRAGRIAGAGLDVFEQEPLPPDSPLFPLDNVTLTNHYASYSEAAWERAETQLGEEAVRIATGMWPMSLVNPGVRHMVPPRRAARSWDVYARELGGSSDR